MGVQVRPAAIDDVPALISCDQFSLSHPERGSLIERCVRGERCLVGESSSQIAGYVVVTHDFFENGFVYVLVVHPEHRRRGVATSLLRAAEAACRTTKLFASTNASNTAAQALLERAGFCRSGIIENLDAGDPGVHLLQAGDEA